MKSIKPKVRSIHAVLLFVRIILYKTKLKEICYECLSEMLFLYDRKFSDQLAKADLHYTAYVLAAVYECHFFQW